MTTSSGPPKKRKNCAKRWNGGTMGTNEKYRFDDAYEKVYEYDGKGAYVFCGSYLAYGIEKNMTEAEKVEIVNNSE